MTQLDLLAPTADLPPGFLYRPDLITADEEAKLVAQFAGLEFREFEFHGFLGKRRVVSFGFHYDFGQAQLRRVAPIPDFLLPLRGQAAVFAGLEPVQLEHALVTEYMPGAAIGWHRDRRQFGDVIGLSFGAPCRFRLRRRSGDGWERKSLILEPRSAYLLRGEVRRHWEHSIPAAEALRYSVTFRSLAP